MSKRGLRKVQASVAFVERAAWLSRELTRFRARGPGDTENAMRAIERDYGISYATIWSLRYRARQLKDIGVGVYTRIEAAYRSECERQLRKLELELAITKAKAGAADNSVVAAQIVVDTAAARQGDAPRVSKDSWE